MSGLAYLDDLCVLWGRHGTCAVLRWGQPNIFFEDCSKVVLVCETTALRNLTDGECGEVEVLAGTDNAEVVYIVVKSYAHFFFEDFTHVCAI